MNRKAVFDAFRAFLGGKLTQDQVEDMDDFLDAYAGNGISHIGEAGKAIIKEFEGLHKVLPDGRIQAYPDPGTGNLPITVGWGSTRGLDGKPITRNAIFTLPQVEEMFDRDMLKYAGEVSRALGDAPTTQSQFDAMTSFHYNTGAIAKATLTKKHKAGDYQGAADEFLKWKFAGGRVLAGLVRRREAEQQLYLS